MTYEDYEKIKNPVHVEQNLLFNPRQKPASAIILAGGPSQVVAGDGDDADAAAAAAAALSLFLTSSKVSLRACALKSSMSPVSSSSTGRLPCSLLASRAWNAHGMLLRTFTVLHVKPLLRTSTFVCDPRYRHCLEHSLTRVRSAVNCSEHVSVDKTR